MEGEDTRSFWLSCCRGLHNNTLCAINRL
uniref:Uncharacterized protein LOC8282032 isoform X3 n=1 Tax=Rhizophora mucronata TaxID=61149 RepID=A0A2P2QSN3_RHIMU